MWIWPKVADRILPIVLALGPDLASASTIGSIRSPTLGHIRKHRARFLAEIVDALGLLCEGTDAPRGQNRATGGRLSEGKPNLARALVQ